MSRILVALDGMSCKQAYECADTLRPHVAGGKANDLLDERGAGVLNELGFKIRFGDPKIHDIPATVYNRVRRYDGKADFLTVHGTNTFAALKKAGEAARDCEKGPKIIAVTVTTDFDTEECKSVFGTDDIEGKVLQLVDRAKKADLHGIVCSPKEVRMVRQAWPDAIIITPGVRSPGADVHDQKRVGTPAGAVADGADYIVCGREILEAGSPEDQIAAAQRINADVGQT